MQAPRGSVPLPNSALLVLVTSGKRIWYIILFAYIALRNCLAKAVLRFARYG
jgi:hypothetical protein